MEKEKNNSIFLEQDDEVTAVIERIRNESAEEINLVIPKEALILQSIVNVRLLKRAADTMKKRITIETADEVGAKVARAAGIMANGSFEIPELVESAISDTAAETATTPAPGSPPVIPSASEESQAELATEDTQKGTEGTKPPKKPPSRNFELSIPYLKLNTKNALYLGAGLLVALFVLYISFVPRATVVLRPTVEGKAASAEVAVVEGQETDLAAGVVEGQEAQSSKNKTAKFTATGTKEVGEKAKGEIDIFKDDGPAVTLKKGVAEFRVDSKPSIRFVLDEDVTLGSDNDFKGNVKAVAKEIGGEYNVDNNVDLTYVLDPDITAETDGKFSGGSKKTIKVPTQADIDGKTQEIVDELSPIVRKELEDKLSNGKVIESSIVKKTDAKASPGVDEEAPSGEFELAVTYSETAIVFDEGSILELLEQTIKQSVPTGQTTYGVKGDTATYTVLKALENGRLTLKADATVYVGAAFDESEVKKGVRGKNVASARKFLAGLEGLDDYSIDTKPKWYRQVPGSEKRIEIKIQPRE